MELHLVLPSTPSLAPADLAALVCSTRGASSIAGFWIGESNRLDAFALGGAIASSLNGRKLWVGPLAVSVRDPITLALGVATLSSLAGAPVHIGLGASSPVVVREWHGQAWADPVGRLEDAVGLLREVLAGNRTARTTGHARSTGFALLEPSPCSEVALAAHGRKMLAASVDLADRLVSNLLTVDGVRRLRRRINETAKGRSLPLTAWVPLAPHLASQERHGHLATMLSYYLAAPGYGESLIEEGYSDLVAMARSGEYSRHELIQSIPLGLTKSVGLPLEPEAMNERFDSLLKAGASSVAIVPAVDNSSQLPDLIRVVDAAKRAGGGA